MLFAFQIQEITVEWLLPVVYLIGLPVIVGVISGMVFRSQTTASRVAGAFACGLYAILCSRWNEPLITYGMDVLIILVYIFAAVCGARVTAAFRHGLHESRAEQLGGVSRGDHRD